LISLNGLSQEKLKINSKKHFPLSGNLPAKCNKNTSPARILLLLFQTQEWDKNEYGCLLHCNTALQPKRQPFSYSNSIPTRIFSKKSVYFSGRPKSIEDS
jgi:hypothetical protein